MGSGQEPILAMSNFLKMDLVNAIQALKSKGWSKRRIARELQIDRQTVRRYLRAASPPLSIPDTAQADSGQNHPLSTPGSERPSEQNHPLSTLGNLEVTAVIERVFAEPSGRPSKCQTYAERIEAKVHLGLTAQRIYQDLVIEVGFKGSYQAVKRFVRRLKESSPTPISRVEVQPAEEAQADFGSGAPVIEPSGRRRKPWIFRIVLSFSRRAYSEAVWYQTTETFIRCLENAFRYFGGVTKTLNLDNLRAAVSRADWYDPDLNPKFECFCRHYGIALMPCRPRHPEHKGKCERNIGYLKSNAHSLAWSISAASTLSRRLTKPVPPLCLGAFGVCATCGPCSTNPPFKPVINSPKTIPSFATLPTTDSLSNPNTKHPRDHTLTHQHENDPSLHSVWVWKGARK